MNHLRHPDYSSATGSGVPKARSQIELFYHVVNSDSVKHLRSIRHPLIRTPNDILARSSHDFFVTNDHYYREGAKRFVEEMGLQDYAGWTDTVHISLSPEVESADGTEGVTASVAYKGLHCNNGLSHGANESEIAVGLAYAGILALVKPDGQTDLELVDSIQMPSNIDNPSYFHDPYAAESGRDSSGYVLAGLARGIDLPKPGAPVIVWMLQPLRTEQEGRDCVETGGGKILTSKEGKKWKLSVIFQDNGQTIDTASTAVLLPIDPAENGGKKQGWLYVTGPVSEAAVVSRIDIP